jgi:hypothetical protein
MIKWSGRSGDSISVNIRGYEFPEIREGYDANWLHVDVSARNWSGEWTASAPCVLAWDLLNLEFWLDDLEADEAETWMSLEPELMVTSLGWSRGLASISIRLRDGLRHAALDDEGQPGADILAVNVSLEEIEITKAAVQAKSLELPARGLQGTKGIESVRRLREKRLNARC